MRVTGCRECGALSVFVPLVLAHAAPVENCCRLVARSDLDLLEVGALTAAVLGVGTLDLGRVHVFPGVLAAEDIIDFLALELHLVLKLALHAEDVRARPAEEPEVVERLLRQQNVRARRTEQHVRSVVSLLHSMACLF